MIARPLMMPLRLVYRLLQPAMTLDITRLLLATPEDARKFRPLPAGYETAELEGKEVLALAEIPQNSLRPATVSARIMRGDRCFAALTAG